MKHLFVILALFAMFFSATAAELPAYLEEMQDEYTMNIGSISDDDIEDDNDNEFIVLEFQSRQDYRIKDLSYLMRVIVQLTDKKTKSVVFAQNDTKFSISGNDADYTEWEFQVPFGELKKPKLTAYTIEFGFMKDGYFVPVAVEYDKVDSAEEITNSEGVTEVGMECTKFMITSLTQY